MKERSSTISVNGYSNRPFDRALGAAATLGLGLFLFQTFCRYLRRMKGDDSNSWRVELTKLLRNSVKEGRSSSEDEAWHAGGCHCRSVLFQFLGPLAIIAKDGQGKIHYPHIRVKASDFRIMAGGSNLKMYYVSVPASGSTLGVAPDTAAFTFCSRCGVHVLHAPSAHSNMLDVNVECLDTAANWSLSKTKHNLSQGVPASGQWKHHFEDVCSDEGDENLSIALSTNGLMTTEFGNGAGTLSPKETWRLPTPKLLKIDSIPVSPGTPSTSSTSCAESQFPAHPHLNRMDNAGGEEHDEVVASPPLLKLPPSIRSQLPTPLDVSHAAGIEGVESIATPKMRDQLNYYIGKHVTSSSSNKGNTPKAGNGLQAKTDDGATSS